MGAGVPFVFLGGFNFGGGDGDGRGLGKGVRTMVVVFSPQVKQEKKAYIKI